VIANGLVLTAVNGAAVAAVPAVVIKATAAVHSQNTPHSMTNWNPRRIVIGQL
jgi:hypothetical protein